MSRKERARALFYEGFNCSQAVVAAYADLIGMDEKTALKLASSFGGGMGRMREVCGAVTGMFMVAGLLYGYDSPADKAAVSAHYARIQQLAASFREKHGTILCRELLAAYKPGSDPVPTPRDDRFYNERPCAVLVMDACDILDDLIAKNA